MLMFSIWLPVSPSKWLTEIWLNLRLIAIHTHSEFLSMTILIEHEKAGEGAAPQDLYSIV